MIKRYIIDLFTILMLLSLAIALTLFLVSIIFLQIDFNLIGWIFLASGGILHVVILLLQPRRSRD